MKKFIGLTSDWRESKYYAPTVAINSNYLKGVLKASGFPIILSAIMPLETVREILEQLSGIIFIGGADIEPSLYNEPRHPMTVPMKTARHNFDQELVKLVLASNKPLLGICQGIQVINVALGGKLFQDVPSDFPNSNIRHRKLTGCSFTEHPVKIARDSLLYKVIGKEEIIVNSSHHQAISVLAPGLRAVAWAPDGVIEAAEATDERPILAVQWHPEYLIDREEHLNLFRWVVNSTDFLNPIHPYFTS